jgi:hypothetical protein
MRRLTFAVAGTVLIAVVLGACGGGESKSENQILEERAFQAHSEYLLAEGELLGYRSKDAASKELHQLDASADKLLSECEAAITEQECSVREPLESVVHEIDGRAHP